jgi:hypothetical protein
MEYRFIISSKVTCMNGAALLFAVSSQGMMFGDTHNSYMALAIGEHIKCQPLTALAFLHVVTKPFYLAYSTPESILFNV